MTIPRKMEVCFFRNPSKSPGWVNIYVQISISGQKLRIGSTGIRVPIEDWDSKKKEISASNPACMAYNATLTLIKTRLITIFNDLFSNDQHFTAYEVKNQYVRKYNDQVYYTLIQRFNEYWNERKTIARKADEEKRKRPAGSAEQTIKSIGPIFHKLKEYLEAKKEKNLRPLEFDQDYYEDYISWMREKGYAESTIRAHCNKIKQLYHWMKRKKYININQLEGLPLPKDPGTKPSPLTQQEFDQLCRHRFKNKRMQEAADLFIIHCRTGFHYQDLQNLIIDAQKGIKVTIVDRDGIEWIYHDRTKTTVEAKVPVLPEVKALIDKYGGWQGLPKFPNQKFNDWLKLVAAETGIHEDLSVSHGRDTMTDWLLNEKLASEETVLVILGRKDGRDLSRYGKSDERRVIKELNL